MQARNEAGHGPGVLLEADTAGSVGLEWLVCSKVRRPALLLAGLARCRDDHGAAQEHADPKDAAAHS
jgi:hypothetical protein